MRRAGLRALAPHVHGVKGSPTQSCADSHESVAHAVLESCAQPSSSVPRGHFLVGLLTLLPEGPCATKVAYALQMLQCFPLHRSS